MKSSSNPSGIASVSPGFVPVKAIVAGKAIVCALQVLTPVLDLGIRIMIGLVFFQSGLTKIANWESTVSLFENEYAVPLLPPELAAYVATAVELTTPILLLLGLATRLGAAAMLGMTLVIQVFVYPENYPDHLLWAGPLLYLILRGPGALSLDHLIRRHMA